MATAFNDKDTTFGNGINIAGGNYEVHRFYEEDGNNTCHTQHTQYCRTLTMRCMPSIRSTPMS